MNVFVPITQSMFRHQAEQYSRSAAREADKREVDILSGLLGLGLQLASVSLTAGGRRANPEAPVPLPVQQFPQQSFRVQVGR